MYRENEMKFIGLRNNKRKNNLCEVEEAKHKTKHEDVY